MRSLLLILPTVALAVLGACDASADPAPLTVESTAFPNHGAIPSKYTCEGKGVSPPLAWSGAPDGTKSFALIMDDPDAPDPRHPRYTFVHWIVYNLPQTTNHLPEAVHNLPDDAMWGRSDAHHASYAPPCPPKGRHRYFLKIYALDSLLPATLGDTAKPDLEKAMKGHVLSRGELMGTYEKKR